MISGLAVSRRSGTVLAVMTATAVPTGAVAPATSQAEKPSTSSAVDQVSPPSNDASQSVGSVAGSVVIWTLRYSRPRLGS